MRGNVDRATRRSLHRRPWVSYKGTCSRPPTDNRRRHGTPGAARAPRPLAKARRRVPLAPTPWSRGTDHVRCCLLPTAIRSRLSGGPGARGSGSTQPPRSPRGWTSPAQSRRAPPLGCGRGGLPLRRRSSSRTRAHAASSAASETQPRLCPGSADRGRGNDRAHPTDCKRLPPPRVQHGLALGATWEQAAGRGSPRGPQEEEGAPRAARGACPPAACASAGPAPGCRG